MRIPSHHTDASQAELSGNQWKNTAGKLLRNQNLSWEWRAAISRSYRDLKSEFEGDPAQQSLLETHMWAQAPEG